MYVNVESLSQDVESRQKWFHENVLMEFTQTWAEHADGTARKETNELVRSLNNSNMPSYDLMKPQFYVVRGNRCRNG